MPAVRLIIPALSVGALTREDGRYVLVNVPAGTHVVQAQVLGFRTETMEVAVGAGQTATVDFQMQEDALALDEIIVTGTPGGTQRRALGNAVNQLEVSEIAEQIAVPSVQNVLTGRVPGLQYQYRSGNVGTGSRIQIRGTGSFNLSTNPLIYIDGVRVNNSSRSGPAVGTGGGVQGDDFGGGAVNVLNDLNPADIESVEIIKGPAAATLYGTEASAGVIQIITKRGEQGAPQFDVAISQGANFLTDPAGRLGTYYVCRSTPTPPCPEADLIPYNMYDEANGYISGEVVLPSGERVFDWPEEKVYRYGHVQNYDLSVRGGTEGFRYYVSGNVSDEGGIEYYNRARTYRLRANTNLLLSESLTFDLSTNYIEGDTRFADPVVGEGGSWRNMKVPVWQCLVRYRDVASHMRDCPRQAGFYEQLPSDAAKVETTRDYNRFIGGATLNHSVGERFTQRAIFGIDKGWDRNQRLFPIDPVPVYPQTAEGTIDYERPNSTNLSFEYTANLNIDLGSRLTTQTSVGAQYFIRQLERIRTEGRGFASTLSTTINQVPTETMIVQYDDISNKSMGVFVQEQLGLENRLFLTGAIRLDDNSAFGSDFDAQIYPKVSAAWVVSEEPFWRGEAINSLRLRAAWGKAGRQPSTFAGTNIYGVVPAPGTGGAILPVQPGNPEVGPEVSSEVEVGLDVALFDDRVSGEFTYFRQRNEGALLNQVLAPSLGFPGSVQQNLGRIDNWGWEALVQSRLYEGNGMSFDLALNGSYVYNEIKDLGAAAGSNTIRLGYPYPNYTTPYAVLSAEQDPTGQVIRSSAMCDSGVRLGSEDSAADVRGITPGGTPMPCEELGAQNLLVGPAFSPYTFSVNPTLTLFDNALSIFAMAEGKFGGWSEDSLAPWTGQFAGTSKYWSNDDPIWLAGRLNIGPFRDTRVDEHYQADFWTLREVGIVYQLPESLVQRTGARRASLSFSGRELMTLWRRTSRIAGVTISDPELGSPQIANEDNWYVTPPNSSVHLMLRVSF